MKYKTGLRKKIQTVWIITLCWTAFGCVSFLNQYFFIYDLLALKKLSGSFPFWGEFTGSIIFALLGGLVAGYVLVFKMGSRYRRKSFAFGVINSGFLFIVTYVGLAVIGLLIIDVVYFSFQMPFSAALSKSIDMYFSTSFLLLFLLMFFYLAF